MSGPLFALTPRTADQLRRLLADKDLSPTTADAPNRSAAFRGVTWVKIIAIPADGWNPGVVSLDRAGDWIDLSGDVRVKSADGTTLNVGTRYLCIRTGDAPDGAARFHTFVQPAPVVADDFFARLTTASAGKWKWVRLKLNSSGAFVDDGFETASFNATPATIDGTNLLNPVAGLRVYMRTSVQAGLYEFLPIGTADATHGGLLATPPTAQTIGGDKTFADKAHFDKTIEAPAGIICKGATAYDDFYAASTGTIFSMSAPYTQIQLGTVAIWAINGPVVGWDRVVWFTGGPCWVCAEGAGSGGFAILNSAGTITKGITTTIPVKDWSGANHTITVTGGIITGYA